MIFMLVICVVTDKRYSSVPNFLQPLYIGFTLLAIGVAYGSNGGYALNPVLCVLAHFSSVHYIVTFAFVLYQQARDLAPRLVTFLGGWGLGVFR